MFSRATYLKALGAPRPKLLSGDPADLETLTTWAVGSASAPNVTYVVLTDGDELLTCTCRRGQTRTETEQTDCYHAASVLLELQRRADSDEL